MAEGDEFVDIFTGPPGRSEYEAAVGVDGGMLYERHRGDEDEWTYAYRAPGLRTPRERWGTCCPHDPYCDHSFLDDAALAYHLDTPITDADAAELGSL
jgi:hypothetical protein